MYSAKITFNTSIACLFIGLLVQCTCTHYFIACTNVVHACPKSYPTVNGFTSIAAITCEDQPCMNGGKCIPSGHSETVQSRFVYFQCECIHPYKGLMCDTTCDADCMLHYIYYSILNLRFTCYGERTDAMLLFVTHPILE